MVKTARPRVDIVGVTLLVTMKTERVPDVKLVTMEVPAQVCLLDIWI